MKLPVEHSHAGIIWIHLFLVFCLSSAINRVTRTYHITSFWSEVGSRTYSALRRPLDNPLQWLQCMSHKTGHSWFLRPLTVCPHEGTLSVVIHPCLKVLRHPGVDPAKISCVMGGSGKLGWEWLGSIKLTIPPPLPPTYIICLSAFYRAETWQGSWNLQEIHWHIRQTLPLWNITSRWTHIFSFICMM